jgi:hypothetical protein
MMSGFVWRPLLRGRTHLLYIEIPSEEFEEDKSSIVEKWFCLKIPQRIYDIMGRYELRITIYD